MHDNISYIGQHNFSSSLYFVMKSNQLSVLSYSESNNTDKTENTDIHNNNDEFFTENPKLRSELYFYCAD